MKLKVLHKTDETEIALSLELGHSCPTDCGAIKHSRTANQLDFRQTFCLLQRHSDKSVGVSSQALAENK